MPSVPRHGTIAPLNAAGGGAAESAWGAKEEVKGARQSRAVGRVKKGDPEGPPFSLAVRA
jgi:hypothetical protein